MVNWVPIVAASLAAIPAAAIFFVAYGRYDGAFQDRVVFLYFVGGLFMGGILGFLTLLLFAFFPTQPLVQVIALALLLPIAVVATINRRKWHGERHAIFNGGAAGLGIAVMMGFSFLYSRFSQPYLLAQRAANDAWAAAGNTTDAPAIASAPYAFNAVVLGQGILIAIALAGLFFGLGLLAGDGVRRRKQLSVAFIGTAIIVAPVIFLEEYFRGGDWIWTILLAAYGAIFALAAERRLLIQGIDDEARKERRRARRKAAE